jgi:hypothetical protein
LFTTRQVAATIAPVAGCRSSTIAPQRGEPAGELFPETAIWCNLLHYQAGAILAVGLVT